MSPRRPVYSTETGRLCPDCGKPIANCECRTKSTPASPALSTPSDGIIRLQRQTRGRNGKPVVIITGLPLVHNELKQLAGKLKSRCGVGGTVENGTIIIQGDKREILKSELEALGHTVKLAGG